MAGLAKAEVLGAEGGAEHKSAVAAASSSWHSTTQLQLDSVAGPGLRDQSMLCVCVCS